MPGDRHYFVLAKTIALFFLAVVAAMPAWADITTGLAGRWAFDETSGLVANPAAGSISGSIEGGVTLGVAGKTGTAFSFDGADDRVQLTGSAASLIPATGAFTVAMFVKCDGTPGTGTSGQMQLFSNNAGQANRANLGLIDGNADGFLREIYWFHNGGLGQVNTTLAVPNDGAFHLVALTRDGSGNFTAWLDGASFALGNSGAAISLAQDWRIGSTAAENNFRYKGTADEVRVYSRALSAADIVELAAITNPDTTAPALLSAASPSANAVTVLFSEPMATASASVAGNYALLADGVSVGVTAASVSGDGLTVTLTTATPLALGAVVRVTPANLRDRATPANLLPPGSAGVFVVGGFSFANLGGNAAPMLTTGATTTLTGAGSGLGGTSDQGAFGSTARTGDFDVRAQLSSLTRADVWTRFALMARESSTAVGSRFAAAVATPTLAGCFFQWRDPAASAAQQNGAYPPNLPYLWLRLKRAGNVFTGFASTDGQGWSQLGSATITLPATVEVGVSLASQSETGGPTTAQFANFGDVTGSPAVAAAPATEPPGPCSRLTGVTISEIMYQDRARADGRVIEFVELFNSDPIPADLSGWRLTGDIAFTFPAGTTLAGGAYLVVARVPADMAAEYGLGGALGPYTGTLKKPGTVRLRDDLDALLLQVNYDDSAPWPAGSEGTGHSLVLRRPSYGEDDPRAWAVSERRGGSPGAFDAMSASAGAGVVINEFLANSKSPFTDFIELYNRTAAPVDVAGCTLTDNPALAGFTIPPGTVLAAGAFVSFDEATLGFSLGSNGETIYLRSPDGMRLIDAVRFHAQLPNVSSGRAPDGAPDFTALAARTAGAANAARLGPDVVINELHIKPADGDTGGEFIELLNRTGVPVDLGGWKLKGGVSFTFPVGTSLAANGFVVAANNRTALLAAHPGLSPALVFGNFGGTLGNTRDHVRLTRPMTFTNGLGQPATDDATVDELAYGDGAAWGRWADGGGSSLEKIDARADGRHAAAWADSDETAASAWTQFEATGRIDLGQQASGDASINRLELMLGGAGECLIDDLEVTVNGGPNLVANPSFGSGIAGYTALGTHSIAATSGALKLSATSAGDNAANRVHTILTNAIPTGATCTIRCRARWLAGTRDLLLRLEGNWHELSAHLPVPAGGGTPGAVNSRAVANIGPAIYELTATPVLPAANEPVKVTARFDDPDGVATRTLSWRLDVSATFTDLAMNDAGTGGDDLAGDGVFTATIPGQAAGALVVWNVGATDAVGAAAQAFVAPAFGLVRFGESVPASAFVTQRFWMTTAEIARWTSSSFLSNASYSGTFVVGNARAIYGADIRFAGSPSKQGKPQYATPTAGPAHYTMNVPRYDRFLGTDDFSKLHAPGNDPFADADLQHERTYYWAAHRLGVAGGHRRYFVWLMNGSRHGTLMEDAVEAGKGLLDSAFDGASGGPLYRMNIWEEFGDAPATPITATTAVTNGAYTTLSRYTTTDPTTGATIPKIARHRWNWDPRTGASWSDYAPIVEMVTAASQTGAADFSRNVDALLDLDQWARVIALDHACGNGDSYGNRNGQNMFAYRPPNARWQLIPYDRNLTFGYDFFGATDLFQFWQEPANAGRTADPNFVALLNHPAFRRAWWATYSEISARVFDPAVMNPVLDATYRAFVGDGLAVADPSALKSWVATQRANLQSGLAANLGSTAWSVTTANNQTVTNGQFTLAGTAPAALLSVAVNGVEVPLIWSSLTAWSTSVLLHGGANTLVITGLDRDGAAVGATALMVNFAGTNAWPGIRINEWMASNGGFVRDPADNHADDWIELFNPTASAASLDGWSISDSGTTYPIPAGFSVPAGGYLIVWADNETAQNNLAARPDLHAPFQLGASGDAITLRAPDGTVMDSVTFGAQATNKSSGRWPAAAPDAVLALDAPTFGAANSYTPPAPQAASYVSGGGSFTLSWSSVAGLRYTFERSTDLAAWTPLTTVTATTTTSMATDNAVPAGKAFFRARVLSTP